MWPFGNPEINKWVLKKNMEGGFTISKKLKYGGTNFLAYREISSGKIVYGLTYSSANENCVMMDNVSFDSPESAILAFYEYVGECMVNKPSYTDEGRHIHMELP